MVEDTQELDGRVGRVERSTRRLRERVADLEERVDGLEDGGDVTRRAEKRVLVLIPAIAVVLAAIITGAATMIGGG